jgi:MoxR-like ATPase
MSDAKSNKSNNKDTKRSVVIDGVEIFLSRPDELDIQIVGAQEVQKQLLASWILVDKNDLPLTPRLLGRPGVGKTTLGYAVGKSLGRDVYIYQCTMDTRPEDLIITPVISDNNKIKYQASPLVSAMIKGGVAILDEGNRMMEKAWASLAPLFDNRRYVESITAGVKVKAHPDFRCAITMNNDSSTFEVPEYIMSRLQPQIFIDFPTRNEEKEILKVNLPFSEEDMLDLISDFLSRTHTFDEPFTSRDGIHIIRYARKLMEHSNMQRDNAIRQAISQVLGRNALNYLDPNYKPNYYLAKSFDEFLGDFDDGEEDGEDGEDFDEDDGDDLNGF